MTAKWLDLDALLQWLLALLSLTIPTSAAEPGRVSLIPRPARLRITGDTFELSLDTRIIAGTGTEVEARNLAEALGRPTGWMLPVVAAGPARGTIVLDRDRGLQRQLGPEGYHLTVTPGCVVMRAATEAGLFYAGITFRQLLPPEAFAVPRPSRPPGGGWRAACVEIRDAPRFAWRGLLLDMARHFMPVEFLREFIDVMALYKLNTLQLHLTDDQGWRIEFKKYPRLTAIGSVRAESPARGDRGRGDGTPYGPFFYTQDEIRALVAYARSRHVTLVPAIEIPGHALAAIAAYPELSCRGRPVRVRTRWGVEPNVLCPGKDAAVAFARDVLGVVCDLFPGRFIHIGGDGAPRDRWRECPRCQARIRAEGLDDEAQLQTWLNHRLEDFLGRRHRRLVGWDEILEGGLTPGAVVMSWHGGAGGLAAARAGQEVVMTPTTHCYFDYAQARGPGEPKCIGGLIPLETVYRFEPIPAGLDAARRRLVLGAQGNLWTEFLRTPRDVEYFAFPRAGALAEVAWSPSPGRDVDDFLTRLRGHQERLDALGVNHRRLDESARGGREPGPR
jgi:hexosaminidase